MRVKRAFQQVLLAHRLPEKMDDATRAFGARNQLAISELPNGGFAIFDLRWSMANGHAIGLPGQIIVLDGTSRLLTEDEFKFQYVDIDAAVEG